MVNPFPVIAVTISPITTQRLYNCGHVSASYSLWAPPARRLTTLDVLSDVLFSVTPPGLPQMQHFCLLSYTADGSLSLLWCLVCSWLPDFTEAHPVAAENILTYHMTRWSHWNRPVTDTSKNVTGVGICFSVLGLLFSSPGMLERVEMSTGCGLVSEGLSLEAP